MRQSSSRERGCTRMCPPGHAGRCQLTVQSHVTGHRLGQTNMGLAPPGLSTVLSRTVQPQIIIRAQGCSSQQGCLYGNQHREIQTTFPIRWILVPRSSRHVNAEVQHGVKYLPPQDRQTHTKLGASEFKSLVILV